MMLLRFSTSDVCNATLTEATTGEVAYRISTTRPRSSSRTSFMSISSRSQDGQSPPPTDRRTTVVKDSDGEVVAEIVWEANCASRIRIRDEEMRGTSELFDAAFVKVLPDETLIPTRMEYVWRLTPDSVTLLDDDGEVIGELHANCWMVKGQLVPARLPSAGYGFLSLDDRPPAETLELIVCYLLLSTLRARMYLITRYVYGQGSDRLSKLRRRATRSFVHLRETMRRIHIT
ncbi:hypothetical protein CERSUDRAFT_113226 [Gelatoporia subvermispora B]|uniref:DUF6593 domain-containing protein n=1 Tax=Ceriporiopsis subvermispora (strain B) TaxID=914234 RepID=M2RH06_CERS8|nr:hypothetical protein CERSUDRAFT_113226 [Gelatoporia subvermispora B]